MKRFMTAAKSLVLILSIWFLSFGAEAFTYSAAVKTARMTAVEAQIDIGGSAGKLELGTSGMATVCATITLNATAGTVSGSVLTLSGFPKTVAATTSCTLAEARVKTSANADVITGLTVGTSGTNIVLDSLSVVGGQNITITSAAFTHA
jgi:hypothetical protein